MVEREKRIFFDMTGVRETVDIRTRCNDSYLKLELKKYFPEEKFKVTSVTLNETGKYKKIKQLPPYVEVVIEVETGKVSEEIIVWSPLAWNDRFFGTGGGGTGIGGRNYFTMNNTSRAMTVPFAICNGFTSATADGRNVKKLHDYMIDKKTKEFNWDYYENWRLRTTHDMARFGKAVAEILHKRPVIYSYMHASSGGGRQSFMEAQNYPNDFNGIWASCPAINWTKFLVAGLYFIGIMNSNKNVMSYEKLKFFMDKVHESVGGFDKFHDLDTRVDFDPYSLVGQKTPKGELITKVDAKCIEQMWTDPDKDFYIFRPGIQHWNHYVPVGSFYYNIFTKKPTPFILVTMYCRWVTGNPKEKFLDATLDDFYRIYKQSIEKFPTGGADNPDLRPFAECGGKLMTDHGYADPLIPIDGTISYYNKVVDVFGSKEEVDKFWKLYLNPGDGHGSCDYFGPGLTEITGVKALMDWVENGVEPGTLPTVRVKEKTHETIEESTTSPY